ncbi:thioredoxin [Paenalcaligenes suwonensis]|uniref:thioredoxin n=1 Tax=Paenalcaligenes suwonensis TaxID=1202713 RepID=UPI00140DFCB0|nr:thioredoxin [Paenalcaligenes suwonensis]NHC60194.1 thioredoxin [Paenalcaligenes suwonensis]
MITHLDTTNFEQLVTNAPGLHTVRFWAEWCGPCRMMAPIYQQTATALQEQASFGEVDIDAVPELANQFRVQSIPTVLLFKDGQVVDRMIGAAGQSQLQQLIQRHAD